MISGRTASEQFATRALPWCAAAVAVFACIWAAQQGALMKLDRDLEQAHAVALETEQVCARLDAARGTPRFLDCAIELDAVRQSEQGRRLMQESGLP